MLKDYAEQQVILFQNDCFLKRQVYIFRGLKPEIMMITFILID